jgi:hypothetical protein
LASFNSNEEDLCSIGFRVGFFPFYSTMRANSFFTPSFLLLASGAALNTYAFTRLDHTAIGKRNTIALNAVADDSRRNFLIGAGMMATQGALLPICGARAEGEASDLTTQLFNPDGSLKAEVEEAKSMTIEFVWGDDAADNYSVNIDGSNSAGTDTGSKVRLSYQIPEKWQRENGGYIDKSTSDKAKACQKIIVYRAPGKVTPERLAKATTIGLAEALYVTDDLKVLKGADLISGRTRQQADGTKFYDFDMALAPKTCGDSKDNLGLGFCPFDTIYLLSAAVIDDSLYVMALECDKSEWKVANSDLKRVRSSFAVSTVV